MNAQQQRIWEKAKGKYPELVLALPVDGTLSAVCFQLGDRQIAFRVPPDTSIIDEETIDEFAMGIVDRFVAAN